MAAVVIVVVVLLAVIFVLATMSRRDTARLSRRVNRETVERDKASPVIEEIEAEGPPRSGREIERAAVLERRGGQLVTVEAPPPPVAPPPPPDPEVIGITRRQVLNRGIVGLTGVATGGFTLSALIAFLWPPPSEGFGGRIRAGNVNEIRGAIASNREPFYVAEARSYLTAFPVGEIDRAREAYSASLIPGMENGLIAIFQRCVHLGCRVPWCHSAQWFECPCHGSRYNRAGEHKAGPAPRGLDRFPIDLAGDAVIIDTGSLILGPPIGTNTTGQEAEGPHCA